MTKLYCLAGKNYGDKRKYAKAFKFLTQALSEKIQFFKINIASTNITNKLYAFYKLYALYVLNFLQANNFPASHKLETYSHYLVEQIE